MKLFKKKEEGLVLNVGDQKILLDQLLKEHYSSERYKLDQELANYKHDVGYTKRNIALEFQTEVLKYKQQMAEDWKTYEHDFHSEKERRGIELAKLEAAEKEKKNYFNEEKNNFSEL